MKKRGNLKYCMIVLILSWVLSPVLAQLDDAEKTKAGRI